MEADVSTTLWRHTDSVTRHTSGARDTQLVVRNLATVGNYGMVHARAGDTPAPCSREAARSVQRVMMGGGGIESCVCMP